jgi:hypothetical protein
MDDDPSVRKLRMGVLFEATTLLRSMGKAIPPTCSANVLQVSIYCVLLRSLFNNWMRRAHVLCCSSTKDIKRVFTSLLSNDWPITSHAVSSLAVFGSTIHAAHQQILPACLPKSRIGLFQARIQGLAWKDSGVYAVSLMGNWCAARK